MQWRVKIIQKNAHHLIRVWIWSGRRVSNPLPAAWKAAALPNELLPQVKTFPQSLWGRVDSNHRTPKRTDLQSVAIAAMPLPRKNFEPIDGLEPPTGWLQISCSTNWAISAWDCVCLSNNVPRFWGCKNTLFSYAARYLAKKILFFFKTLIWKELISATRSATKPL